MAKNKKNEKSAKNIVLESFLLFVGIKKCIEENPVVLFPENIELVAPITVSTEFVTRTSSEPISVASRSTFLPVYGNVIHTQLSGSQLQSRLLHTFAAYICPQN